MTSCPICSRSTVRSRPERLRDSEVIQVLACVECGHVFLSSFEHVGEEYFANNQFLESKSFVKGEAERSRHFHFENEDRASRVGPMVANKTVLDFGCGDGALMRRLRPLAARIDGLERTRSFRERVVGEGFEVFEDAGQITRTYDVILMFHVLEHLPDPVNVVKRCFDLLSPGGLLFIEVPNINDALLSLYEIEAYRSFHFFKDHLQYFSRSSLKETFQRAGIERSTISGHNRFGLANHLYWLKAGKPGGHMVWNFLETGTASHEYTKMLAGMDMSDSLVAQVRK